MDVWIPVYRYAFIGVCMCMHINDTFFYRLYIFYRIRIHTGRSPETVPCVTVGVWSTVAGLQTHAQ